MDTQEKTFWLDFIKSRIDGDIASSRKSGFTIWALATVLVIILYRLIDGFGAIFQNDKRELLLNWFPYFVATTLNICLAIWFFLSAIFEGAQIDFSKRILTTASKKSLIVGQALLSIVKALLLYYNAKALFSSDTVEYIRWPFYIFVIFHLMEFGVVLNRGARRLYINFWKKFEIPDFQYLALRHPKLRTTGVMLNLLQFGIFLIPLIFLINGTTFNITPQEIGLLLKTALELSGLMIVSMTLVIKLSETSKMALLENLERQIIKDEVTNYQVREFLAREIFGLDLKEWLIDKREKCTRNCSAYRNLLYGISQQLDKLETLSSKPDQNAIVHLKTLIDDMEWNEKVFRVFVEKMSYHMKELKSFVIPTDDESDTIKSLKAELDNIESCLGEETTLIKRRCEEFLKKI